MSKLCTICKLPVNDCQCKMCPICDKLDEVCTCGDTLGVPLSVAPEDAETPTNKVKKYQEKIRAVIREAEEESHTGDIVMDLTLMRITSAMYRSAIQFNEEMIKHSKEIIELVRERDV